MTNNIEYYPCDFGFLVLHDGWLTGWVEVIPQNKAIEDDQ